MRGPNDMDNPDGDQELCKGDGVYLAAEDEEGKITMFPVPYVIQLVGLSQQSFDYMIRDAVGCVYRVKVEDVRDIDGKTCLINTKFLQDNIAPTVSQTYEEYELLGTKEARPDSYVIVRWKRSDNEEIGRKFPIAVWGYFMVKKYHDKGQSAYTVLRPMICLPKQLDPQRVTDEMFIDWITA